jgi:hypothetical protein
MCPHNDTIRGRSCQLVLLLIMCSIRGRKLSKVLPPVKDSSPSASHEATSYSFSYPPHSYLRPTFKPPPPRRYGYSLLPGPYTPYKNLEKLLMACVPKVDQMCREVMRAVTVVKEVERCFEVPNVECQEPKEPMTLSVCTSNYEMDRKLTTATVTRIKRDTECTKLRSKNYRATFCFYLPTIVGKEVGATLVFPATKEACEEVKIENLSNNCELKTTIKCIKESVPTTEIQMQMECQISQQGKECKKVPHLNDNPYL